MAPYRVETADGYITLAGVASVLAMAGIRPSRRSIQYFVKRGNYPTRQLGRSLLVPQRVVPDFITDWRSRHSD